MERIVFPWGESAYKNLFAWSDENKFVSKPPVRIRCTLAGSSVSISYQRAKNNHQKFQGWSRGGFRAAAPVPAAVSLPVSIWVFTGVLRCCNEQGCWAGLSGGVLTQDKYLFLLSVLLNTLLKYVLVTSSLCSVHCLTSMCSIMKELKSWFFPLQPWQ